MTPVARNVWLPILVVMPAALARLLTERKFKAADIFATLADYADLCRDASGLVNKQVVIGGYGYTRAFPLEMYYRNARALSVLDGLVGV